MDTYKQIKQLDSLVATIDDLLAEPKVAAWHSGLLQEVKDSFLRIQQKATTAIRENLIDQMTQQLANVEREIQISLAAPLSSLRRLVDANNLAPDLKAQLLIQVGKTYDILGQWNRALDVFYQSLDFCTDDNERRAEIFKFLGHIKSKMREYSSATKLYLDSLSIYVALKNQHEIANIYLCQGYNDFEQGDYGQAEDYYRLALKLATDTEDIQLIADCNNCLGIMATVKGTPEDAAKFFRKAIQFYEKTEDIKGLSTTYHNLAMLQVDMENWKDAGEAYQRALKYAQQVGNLELMGLIHLNRAELALKLYDYATAQACCRHALTVFGRLGSQTRIAEAYKFLGCVHSRQQDWEDAERFFTRGIQMNDSAKNILGVGEARYEYGLMLIRKGERDNAKQQLNQALAIFEELNASADVQRVKEQLEKLQENKEGKAAKIKSISQLKSKRKV